jgi:hypothetical protein
MKRWSIVLFVASVSRGAIADDDDAYADARRHFNAGVVYLQDPEGERFEDAYNEFKLAFELSQAPKVLGNLALCAMKLERDGEAIDGYTRYLRDVADIDPQEREQIQTDLAAIGQSVATVTLVTDESGTIHDTRYPVRGQNVSNVYDVRVGRNAYRLRPGRHLIVLVVAGQERGRWELVAPAGGSLVREMVAPQPASRERPAPAWHVGPLALTGAGATTLLTASVFGLVTLGRLDDLKTRCPDSACPPSQFDEVAKARTLVRATDILFLAGAVATAAGIGWYAFSNTSTTRGRRTGLR